MTTTWKRRKKRSCTKGYPISDDRGNVLKAKKNLNAMSVRKWLTNISQSRSRVGRFVRYETEGASERMKSKSREIITQRLQKRAQQGISIIRRRLAVKKQLDDERRKLPFEHGEEQYEKASHLGSTKGKVSVLRTHRSADVDVGDDTIEVKIEGRHRMNRAMEGDVVGIQIINDENEEEEEEEEKEKATTARARSRSHQS